MKPVLFIISIFCFHSAFSQTSMYHPFPDSSAIWNVQAQGCCDNNCPGPPFPNPVITDHLLSYFLSGDTIINSNSYNKIYKTGTSHAHCLFGNAIDTWYFYNNEYFGGLRQDTILRQVYFITSSSTQECLLYDFSLNVGDTVPGDCIIWGSDCGIITSIDSFAVGTNYRKKFNLSTIPPYSIIEGIGSTSGLVEPLCPFEYSGTLICFSQDNQTIYPDMITGCEILSAIHEISAQVLLNISPNPMVAKATVTLAPDSGVLKWKLFNATGNLVHEEWVHGPSFTIERNRLPSGIYLLQLEDGKGNLYTDRVIMD